MRRRRLSRRSGQKSKASVKARTPCWIGRDQQPGIPGGFLFLQALVNRHGAGHGSADHGVVAHTHQAHHFHVGGYGGGAGKLGVAMHTAHGVGQAVRGGAGGHVVGMQGCGRCRRRKRRRSTFAVFQSPFLIGAELPDAGTGWGWWSCR